MKPTRPFNNCMRIWISGEHYFSHPMELDQIEDFMDKFDNSDSEFITFVVKFGDVVKIKRSTIIHIETRNQLC